MIGNGFDLAHDLPTKYTDFLEWVKIIIRMGKSLEWVTEMPDEERKLTVWLKDHKQPKHWKINFDNISKDVFYRNLEQEGFVFEDGHYLSEILKDVENNSSETMLRVANYNYKESKKMHDKIRKKLIDETKSGGDNRKNKEIYYLLKNNIWVDHFLKSNTLVKENWIDFENEISLVIRSIDNTMRNLQTGPHRLDQINNYFISKYFYMYEEISLSEIGRKLYSDLNKIVRLLEIYLSEYAVAEEILNNKISLIEELHPDKILSFNYTDTYKKIYGMRKNIEYDYIHGKAKIDNTMDTNNMVLGIDEYLPDDRKNKDLEFLAFRKFYQRIYKGTGSEYKKWVDKIKVDWNSLDSRIRQDYMKRISYGDIDEDRSLRFHKLFIFGHSLDVTDKDVLIDFILNDNVYTKIYYPNKKELANKITNLVKVIGQDELIKRTGGSTKTIEFVSQYD